MKVATWDTCIVISSVYLYQGEHLEGSMSQGLVLNTCPMPSREANCPTSTSVFLAEILWLRDIMWQPKFAEWCVWGRGSLNLMNQRVDFLPFDGWLHTPQQVKCFLKRNRSFPLSWGFGWSNWKEYFGSMGETQVPRSVGHVLWLKDVEGRSVSWF